MTDPAPKPFPKKHPLQEDRALLEHISDLMWMEILKVFHQPPRGRPKPGRPGSAELTLIGGASATDVLQEALLDLLRHEPEEDTKWKGLGVRIAQNKAKRALTNSTAYRKRVTGPGNELASLDASNDEGEPLVEQVPGGQTVELTLAEAEDEVERLERQQALHRSANEVLSDRDRQIVFRIQRGETRVEIKDDFGVTAQRIGQIYDKALETLRAQLANNPQFRPPQNNPEGGNPHGE